MSTECQKPASQHNWSKWINVNGKTSCFMFVEWIHTVTWAYSKSGNIREIRCSSGFCRSKVQQQIWPWDMATRSYLMITVCVIWLVHTLVGWFNSWIHMTRISIQCTHEIWTVSKNGSQTNKNILTKLIPMLPMIVLSIKFKFQDLNPIIERDTTGWVKKEPSGALTNSCNI